MGKIQDAIRKVQHIRNMAVSSGSDTRAAPTDDLNSALHGEDAAATPDHSAKERIWNYGGHRIAIDRQKLVEADLLDPDHSRKHLSSEYRQIKKALLANIVGDSATNIRRNNLIMVGSTEQGEGKTFICMNLAMSLALEFGYSVVLVDSDNTNPQLSEMLGMVNEKGLNDLIADGSLDASQTISPTDVPGLAFLPAGKVHEQVAELLANERATELFEGLSTADPKRIFVFDSPSMISSTGVPALAEQVGQILFVVQAEKTAQQLIRQALQKLDRSRAISIVLNQVIDQPS